MKRDRRVKPKLCPTCNQPLGAATLTVHAADPRIPQGQFCTLSSCWTKAVQAARIDPDVAEVRRAIADAESLIAEK